MYFFIYMFTVYYSIYFINKLIFFNFFKISLTYKKEVIIKKTLLNLFTSILIKMALNGEQRRYLENIWTKVQHVVSFTGPTKLYQIVKNGNIILV